MGAGGGGGGGLPVVPPGELAVIGFEGTDIGPFPYLFAANTVNEYFVAILSPANEHVVFKVVHLKPDG